MKEAVGRPQTLVEDVEVALRPGLTTTNGDDLIGLLERSEYRGGTLLGWSCRWSDDGVEGVEERSSRVTSKRVDHLRWRWTIMGG